MTTIVGPAAAWQAQEWAVKTAAEFFGDRATLTFDQAALVPLLRLAWREGYFVRVMAEADRISGDLKTLQASAGKEPVNPGVDTPPAA